MLGSWFCGFFLDVYPCPSCDWLSWSKRTWKFRGQPCVEPREALLEQSKTIFRAKLIGSDDGQSILGFWMDKELLQIGHICSDSSPFICSKGLSNNTNTSR
jgi:hypothetical protein